MEIDLSEFQDEIEFFYIHNIYDNCIYSLTKKITVTNDFIKIVKTNLFSISKILF